MKNFVGHYCSKRDFRPADGCNCYEDDWDQLSKSDVKKEQKEKNVKLTKYNSILISNRILLHICNSALMHYAE